MNELPHSTPPRVNLLYGKNRNYPRRYLKKVKPVTLIIGMYYNRGDGAIIISDSRLQMGTDYYTVQKISELVSGVLISSSGYDGIEDELIDMVRSRVGEVETSNLRDVVKLAGEIERDIYWEYKMGEKPRFDKDDLLIESIIGGIYNDKPRLYVLYERGFPERVSTPPYTAIGDGSRHANSILKRLYYPNVSKERAIEIGVHAIIQTSKIDSVVDDNPQIATIEHGKHRIWNIGENGDFRESTKDITQIKDKINGIGEKQDKLFNLFLDAPETFIEKYNQLIEDYEKKPIEE